MTSTTTEPTDVDLQLRQRLHQLTDAVGLLARHGVDVDVEEARAFLDRAEARLRHGTERTVVALVGSTGSGKSSLLNAVAGAEVARAGVTRPTTAVTQAATFGDPAEGLLDLLGITRRHHLADADPALRGLVLLDLPDFDSVSIAHRLEVDRLVTLVDLMVWVTDPQKYADESLHAGYLQPLSTHAEVMQVVLNKADTLDAAQLEQCLDDLGRLLQADGLGTLTPVPSSTMTTDGVDALTGLLAAEVAARQAAVERISADIDARARSLGERTGAMGTVDLAATQAVLVDGLAAASGVDAVTALLMAQHRRDAVLATGWPPLRFLRRLRRAPLAALPTTAGSQVAQAEVSRTLRRAADTVVAQTGEGWADAAASTVRGQLEEVTAGLDRTISRDVQDLRRPPRWWGVAATLHRVLLAVAVLGGLWLTGLALAGAVLLVDTAPFTPMAGQVPVPTLLFLGGLGLGLVLALLARAVAAAGARARARRAAARLREGVAVIAAEQVVEPLRTLLADADDAAELLQQARRGG